MPILNRKQRVSDEIPTASMADIAFLLLVFFLTTTVFNEEKGLPIVLPEQSEEQDVSAERASRSRSYSTARSRSSSGRSWLRTAT